MKKNLIFFLMYDFLSLSFKSFYFFYFIKIKAIIVYREYKRILCIDIESSGFQSSILFQLLVEHVQSQCCFIFSTLKLSPRARRWRWWGYDRGDYPLQSPFIPTPRFSPPQRRIRASYLSIFVFLVREITLLFETTYLLNYVFVIKCMQI